jgi:cysteine protease ATG4
LTNNHKDSDLQVYITGDGSDVYEDSFMNTAKPDGILFKPTLVLVGTRLGIEKVTPAYWEALQASLQMTQSIGIAG